MRTPVLSVCDAERRAVYLKGTSIRRAAGARASSHDIARE